MGFIKLDFTVAATVEHVWSFGLQAEKIPEWQFDVVAVKGISGSIDRKGTCLTTFNIFRQILSAIYSVTE